MARTKHVARKATGGTAPRIQLPPADPANSTHKPREEAVNKSLPGAGQEANTVRHQFTVYIISPTYLPFQWCRGCEDGGILYACELCAGFFCRQCIAFPATMTDQHEFYCPACWRRGDPRIPTWLVPNRDDMVNDEWETTKNDNKQKKGKKGQTEKTAVRPTTKVRRAGEKTGYRVSLPARHVHSQTDITGEQGLFVEGKVSMDRLEYTGVQTLRGQWPVIDTAPMAIISLRLDGIPLLGDPAALVHHHLAPYYADAPLLFEELEYDLNVGFKDYDRGIAAIVRRVRK
jgi:hypothetical protein